MKVCTGYDSDGHKLWRDEGPSRARISWTVAGSVSGITSLPSPVKRDHSAAVVKGWETRRLSSGQMRGEGLER